MKQNITEIIHTLSNRLRAICPDPSTANQEAWWLLEGLLKKGKSELLLQNDIIMSEQEQQQLDKWLNERINQKKPLQYILGSVPFLGLDIKIKPPILIPRPETEEWVSWLIDKLKAVKNETLSILDLCTGSGCIALALAKEFPAATVIGCDINEKAIELAKENQVLNKINNVIFLQSDLFSSLPQNQKFDLIVSNPPYGSENEWIDLSDEVKKWEDKKAFVSGQNGNEFYDEILKQALKKLKTDSILQKHSFPLVVFELGVNNQAVEAIFEKYGYKQIAIHKDLQGINRWIEGRF